MDVGKLSYTNTYAIQGAKKLFKYSIDREDEQPTIWFVVSLNEISSYQPRSFYDRNVCIVSTRTSRPGSAIGTLDSILQITKGTPASNDTRLFLNLLSLTVRRSLKIYMMDKGLR